MDQKVGKRMKRQMASAEPPRDLAVVLDEIEREPIPEKLLALAFELQEALARRRRESEER